MSFLCVAQRLMCVKLIYEHIMKINEICTTRPENGSSYRRKCNNSSFRFALSIDRYDSWSLSVKNTLRKHTHAIYCNISRL